MDNNLDLVLKIFKDVNISFQEFGTVRKISSMEEKDINNLCNLVNKAISIKEEENYKIELAKKLG